MAGDDEYDPSVENMVVASSSADEADHQQITCKKQPSAAAVEEEGPKKKIEEEKTGGGVRGPRMNEDQFLERYPGIETNITLYAPYRHTLRMGKDVLRDSLLFVSGKKLDELEAGWLTYYTNKWEHAEQRMALILKEWTLLIEAQQAYNKLEQQEKQEAAAGGGNNNNKNKMKRKRRSDERIMMSEMYPRLTSGLLDDDDESETRVIRREDFLMFASREELQKLEREFESYFQSLLAHAQQLVLLMEKQNRLIHIGTKAYLKYLKSSYSSTSTNN